MRLLPETSAQIFAAVDLKLEAGLPLSENQMIMMDAFNIINQQMFTATADSAEIYNAVNVAVNL